MTILKLKKIVFIVIRLLFWGIVDIEKVLVSSEIFFWWKKTNYLIGYLHNGNKVKPLNIMPGVSVKAGEQRFSLTIEPQMTWISLGINS